MSVRWRAAAIRGLLIALSLSACSLLPVGPDTGTERGREIAAHEARWRELGIASYRFTINRGCFCPPDASGPFTVTVEGGAVTSVAMAGKPVAPERIAGVPLTIEAVFSLIRAQPREAAMTMAWDPGQGFPSSVSVDPIPNAVDDEFTISITEFTPLG